MNVCQRRTDDQIDGPVGKVWAIPSDVDRLVLTDRNYTGEWRIGRGEKNSGFLQLASLAQEPWRGLPAGRKVLAPDKKSEAGQRSADTAMHPTQGEPASCSSQRHTFCLVPAGSGP